MCHGLGAVGVSEPEANRIRWIDDTAITTVGGAPGRQDRSPGEACFRHPLGLAAAPDGSVIVADAGNHPVRRIDPDGQVTTLAGGIYADADGPGDRACFRSPAASPTPATGPSLWPTPRATPSAASTRTGT